MRPPSRFVTKDFSGGLVTDLPKLLLSPSQLSNCVNMDPSAPAGMMRKRKGRSLFGSAIPGLTGNGSISGLHVFRKDDGTLFYVASEGTRILSSPTGAAWTNRTGADAPTNNGNVFFTSLSNILVATNPGMVPQEWDGVAGTFTDMSVVVPSGIPTPSGARYCCVYASSVWLASTATDGSRLWKSAAGTVDNFNTVNDSFSAALRPGDGDRIMNITQCGDVLMVPKQNHLYVGYGTSFDDLRFIPHNMANRGLVGERAWAVWGGLFIYCSVDGIYAAGPNTFTEISAPIRNEYKAIADKTVIAGGTFEDQVWFVTNGGIAYVFDARRGSWATYNGIRAKVLYRDIDGRILGGDNPVVATGKIYRFVDPTVTLDEGVAYDMVIAGGDLDFDDWMADKQGDTVWLLVKPIAGATVSLSFTADGVLNTDATILNRSIQALAGSPTALIIREKLPQSLRGRLLQWSLSTQAADFECYGIGMEAKMFEPVGTDR